MAALKRHFAVEQNTIPSEGALLSRAEDLLLGALCTLIDDREPACYGGRQKFDFELERAYRNLKSIARCLKLFPVSEDTRNRYRLRFRMGNRIGMLIKTKDYRVKSNYGEKITSKWQIVEGPLYKKGVIDENRL